MNIGFRFDRKIEIDDVRDLVIRDWASETTNFPREVCEMALAHTIKNQVEAAYRRGDLFAKRRRLMHSWAEFVVRAPVEVVSITARTESYERKIG